jgi:hypothetical protein
MIYGSLVHGESCSFSLPGCCGILCPKMDCDGFKRLQIARLLLPKVWLSKKFKKKLWTAVWPTDSYDLNNHNLPEVSEIQDMIPKITGASRWPMTTGTMGRWTMVIKEPQPTALLRGLYRILPRLSTRRSPTLISRHQAVVYTYRN